LTVLNGATFTIPVMKICPKGIGCERLEVVGQLRSCHSDAPSSPSAGPQSLGEPRDCHRAAAIYGHGGRG
jgi:hypothetical protein